MLCKRALLPLAVMLAAMSLGTRQANACSCGQRPTVLDSYELADIVVIAQIVSVEKSEGLERLVDGVRSTRMIVEQAFKGAMKPGEEMVFAQGGGGDCIWTFGEKDIGKRFLFYLSAKSKGQVLWLALGCGRSKNAEYAADDLLYLDNVTRVRGKSRLSGTLSFSGTSSVEGEKPIYVRLDGRSVRIIGEKKTHQLMTNQNGVYEIYDLPAGRYTIEPEIPDGWKIDYASVSGGRRNREEKVGSKQNKPSFQVHLETGKHAYVDFDYAVYNAIRGKVIDIAGHPMKDVCLQLVPAQGKASKYFRPFDCTDDDGTFEFAGIPPGSFLIVVNEDGKISSSEPFPTFYYPNVFEREKAAVITIGASQNLEEINIYVPNTEETITVEGVCVYSDGKPVIAEWVQFEAETTGDDIEGKARAQTDSAGRFAIKILKGLKGKLYGEMYAYSGKYENCPELEELIKKSERIATLRTNIIEIRVEDSLANVRLKYTFPMCKTAK